MDDEIEINGTVYKIGDRVRGEVRDCEIDMFTGTVRDIDKDAKNLSLRVHNEDDGSLWWIDNDTVEHVEKKYKYSFLID